MDQYNAEPSIINKDRNACRCNFKFTPRSPSTSDLRKTCFL